MRPLARSCPFLTVYKLREGVILKDYYSLMTMTWGNNYGNPNEPQCMSDSWHGCSQCHIHTKGRDLQENTGVGWRVVSENVSLVHHSHQHPGTGLVDADTHPCSVATIGEQESLDTHRYDSFWITMSGISDIL